MWIMATVRADRGRSGRVPGHQHVFTIPSGSLRTMASSEAIPNQALVLAWDAAALSTTPRRRIRDGGTSGPMAENLAEALKCLQGSAPTPDRRSRMALGGGVATLAEVVIGRSLPTGYPTASAPLNPAAAAQSPQSNFAFPQRRCLGVQLWRPPLWR
jgi:hypothetical protein